MLYTCVGLIPYRAEYSSAQMMSLLDSSLRNGTPLSSSAKEDVNEMTDHLKEVEHALAS